MRMLLKLRIMNKRHCHMKKEKEMNILLKITKRMMERNKKRRKKKNRKKQISTRMKWNHNILSNLIIQDRIKKLLKWKRKKKSVLLMEVKMMKIMSKISNPINL